MDWLFRPPTLVPVLRYAITEGDLPGETAAARQGRLLADAGRWAAEGLAFVQLREKALGAGEMLVLAEAMAGIFRAAGTGTKLLVNSRVDVAIAAGADGVHLTSQPDELTPEQVRRVFALAGGGRPIVSVSCHTIAEVERARKGGADLILFGPVFEKRVDGAVAVAGVGLELLSEACRAAGDVPVFALGGVTEANAGRCVETGAMGVAGIRLAQSSDV